MGTWVFRVFGLKAEGALDDHAPLSGWPQSPTNLGGLGSRVPHPKPKTPQKLSIPNP